jgi:pimeloyl-ACP methyl ester carboxylesterase
LEARERVSLVGMSYEGALAVPYALHFPERLEKVVFLAPLRIWRERIRNGLTRRSSSCR